ncbi:MAG TPA: hypothetical protein VHW93_04260 [Acidimicrobiales bacterium]|nr:hypothetical protein [Acidimicrobiales bacterium]
MGRALATVSAVLCLSAGSGVGLSACSSSASPGPSTTAPGCGNGQPTVHLDMTDQQPVPVVRTPLRSCIAVSLFSSPFKGAHTEPLKETPPGRLRLVSDTLQANGTRIAYYVATRPGAVTISSTVKIRTDQPVPAWSGVVIVT